MSGGPNPVSLVSNVLNAGTGVYTAIQVAGLKSMLSEVQSMLETMKTLQIMTMGVSLVGIGISVAGFLYTRKRFNELDSKIDQLMNKIDAGFDSQTKSHLRTHMSSTRSLIERASHAQALSNPTIEYQNISSALADQASFFEGEISFTISTQKPIDLEAFLQLAQTLLLCNSVRVDCQIRSNELTHALRISESIGEKYNHLFNSLTPTSFNRNVDDGLNTVQLLRDATDTAIGRPYLIDYLRVKKIDGRKYIDAIEREKENSLLLLRTN
ncbi:hypothetical protein OPEN69S_00987 [Ottowia pentelensis]